ncbi:hypothetical protein C8N46_102422 [Kordia periserrulae]|uniref:Pentapeptide repeat protein n=1 Tax=Kordia periserrulae TaxID=701523 RepID=A0A2T6C3W9_9FLAO|nr:hypothetical protein [Kordia periserrulae]PTX63021.1 hypothetical protein C8N46_102422 [Kordia periserrulae]
MITEKTYKWVEELLDPKVTEISDEDYDRLVENYFRVDKTDWFEEDDTRIWKDQKQVSDFWSLIRKFSMPIGKKRKLYDFSYFNFPEIDYVENNNFYDRNEKSIFDEKVFFNGAIFLDIMQFSMTIFTKEVEFKRVKFHDLYIINSEFRKSVIFDNSQYLSLTVSNSSFNEDSYFRNNIFNNEFNFNNNTFTGLVWFNESNFLSKTYFDNITFLDNRVIFNEVEFNDDIEFYKCIFYREAQFTPTFFSKKVELIQCEFWDDVHFNQSQFNGITVFDKPIFKKKADFSFCYFEDINLKEINTNWQYRENNYTEPAELYFRDVFFNSKTFFKNSDLTKLELDNCDVSNITFSRCIWNDEKNRLKLVNELPIQSLEAKNKLKLANHHPSKKEETQKLIDKLRDSENHYRQLKKNFDSTKSWELSGKAYVSEMEMRKRRLYLEGKLYQWAIYKFYDVFGGYTQDFRKPIVSIFKLIFAFSTIYFFIDYNVLNAIQRGIKGALPYMEIGIEDPFTGFWLIPRNIELVLGGTFLAFFILALRKRFKQ